MAQITPERAVSLGIPAEIWANSMERSRYAWVLPGRKSEQSYKAVVQREFGFLSLFL